MSAKRLLALAFLTAILSSFLFPQTLAEIAQKERERRAALKGKKATVITNAVLAKLKKKPALETPPAPPAPVTEESAPPQAAPPAAAEAQEQPPAALPAATNPVSPDLKVLQERWDKAREYVELLTLKMGALWQQLYNLEDMTTKDALQQSIAETFIKLQKVQEEETQARQDLEKFLGQQKKESVPSIWIR
jgi:pyruvate/2-oxoglutarate dehydrogenase complex dihydrolipoamide acyltransferase (E2) component